MQKKYMDYAIGKAKYYCEMFNTNKIWNVSINGLEWWIVK